MEKSILIMGIIETFILSIPTLFLVWKNWEKKQSSLTVRIIRKKKDIRKTEIDYQTKLAKLKIELESLEEEARYQQKISKFESGELGENYQKEQTNSTISDLKSQGEQVFQKGSKTVEDLKNKGLNSLNSLKEKGLGAIKGVADQFKGFIPGKKKEGE